MHLPIKLEHLSLIFSQRFDASALFSSWISPVRVQTLPQIAAEGGCVFIPCAAAIPHGKMKLETEVALLFQARTFEYLSWNVS